MHNKERLCLSGGALGADLYWGDLALKYGDELIHYVFQGHPEESNMHAHVLFSNDLKEADPHLKQANKTMRRRFPTKSNNVNSLLRRNWWQVKHSKTVYAATGIDHYGMPEGGTAWAIHMFIDKGGKDCYCLCTRRNWWHKWNHAQKRFVKMETIPPRPNGIYTAIGTRELPEHCKPNMEMIYNQGE